MFAVETKYVGFPAAIICYNHAKKETCWEMEFVGVMTFFFS